MTTHYLQYQIGPEGFVDHWLVAGPRVVPLQALANAEAKPAAIARQVERDYASVAATPCEWDPPLVLGDQEFRWGYCACKEDHLVDRSAHNESWQYRGFWAYAELDCDAPQDVTLEVTTCSPVAMWLDEARLLDVGELAGDWRTARVSCSLAQGHNRVLLCFSQLARGSCPLAFSLRVEGLAPGTAHVALPTVCQYPDDRYPVERVIAAAYLDRELYRADDDIIVRWAPDLNTTADVVLRFQDPDAVISVEAITEGKPSFAYSMLRGLERRDGPYQIRVMPEAKQFYKFNQRVDRLIALYISKGDFSTERYGDRAQRRREALEHAAAARLGIYSELAKMELGRWQRLEQDAIAEAIDHARQSNAAAALDLLAVLHLAHTHLENPSLPEATREAVNDCVHQAATRLANAEESAAAEGIWWSACKLLTRQMLSLDTTPAKQEIIGWLRRRATHGFEHWGSGSLLAPEIVALLAVVELAEDATLRRLAGAMVNKMLFQAVLHAHAGVPTGPQRGSEGQLLRNPQLNPLCSITRVAWGLGAYNDFLAGIVSMAAAKRYEPPLVLVRLARHRPRRLWSYEQQVDPLLPGAAAARGGEANIVTYKTADYVLSSVQDWRRGQRGADEHLWQATLSPDAVVFVTHPPHLSEHPAMLPNAWRGNATLPRIAQWRDALIALHRLPEGDRMGFTHAYFPLYAFDEHLLEGNWAFARVEDGYLALWASQGLELVIRGDCAYRELRAPGSPCAWLCLMGRASQDGDFGGFQERVRALEIRQEALSLRLSEWRGSTISFGWDEPLQVDGEDRPLQGYPHYDNPYCQVELSESAMVLQLGARPLRLDFTT